MKKTKILALILAAIFIALPLLSCDGNGTGEDTSTDTSEETGANVTITVSMKVKNADGDVVYDIPSYVYNGEEPTIIDLIDYYFYMEMDPLYVDIDDEGGIRTIVSIGEIESGEVMGTSAGSEVEEVLYTTLWWYNLNGREGTALLDNYIVKNGDAIEFYLKKVSSSSDTSKK